jgi:hypothetical protein
MIGDPGKDIGQPSLRVDIVQFGSDDQAKYRVETMLRRSRWFRGGDAGRRKAAALSAVMRRPAPPL